MGQSSWKAKLRLYWFTFVVCMGGALFGYDSGVVGGVLTFESFMRDFNYTKADKTRVDSIAVGIQQAGAFVGCFLVWPLTKRIGRRYSIAVCSFVFMIGVILETVISHKIGVFYAGRVICGLGMGAGSTIVPIYMSEMAPKESRGRLGSCYQLMYTVGILVSYWIDYGVKFMDTVAAQWQIPISMQMVPAGIMLFGMLTLKESVRWLVSKDRNDEAWKSLAWIRSDDSELTVAEFVEIQEGVAHDRHAQAGFKMQELLEWPNSKRLLLAFGLFVCQQSCGASALAYFGPQFFGILVGEGDNNLLLTGIFGAIKVVACLTFVLFISERFGRKTLLMGGCALMSACMITTAAVVKTKPPPGNDTITSAGIATVALIYINIMVYNASFGPLPWPCVSEMFPTRIREAGVATGVGGQWLFNFVYSISTPYMMESMGGGWGVFLFYGVLDICCGFYVFFLLKETKGRTLEQINEMYDPTQYSDMKHMEDVLASAKNSPKVSTEQIEYNSR